MKAVKAQELFIKGKNKVGALAALTEIISSGGVNIRAISAWAVGDEAFFRVLTSDNAKTKELLVNNGYDFEEKEVIVVELPDKIGQLSSLLDKLKEANIDLTHIYGTTSKPEHEAILVFSSNDNDKAVEVLSS